MQPVIELRNVYKSYSSRKAPAVCDLNFKIAEGEVVGFLGPNGAGKTTTIKMLLGFLSPQKGSIKVLSHPPYSSPARKMIGYLPETSEYYWFLTPFKLLKLYGTFFDYQGKHLENKIYSLLEKVNIREHAHEMIKNFSKGMKQRVGIAQALINDPQLLILDEPSSGLDPIGRKEIRELIEHFSEQKKTVFFSSHELGEVETVCQRVAIISRGKLLYDGGMQDLKLKNQQAMKIDVSGDFPVVMKKIRESDIFSQVKVYQTPEKIISVELFQRKRLYELIDVLRLANTRILFIGDKMGKVEDIFFRIIQEQEGPSS